MRCSRGIASNSLASRNERARAEIVSGGELVPGSVESVLSKNQKRVSRFCVVELVPFESRRTAIFAQNREEEASARQGSDSTLRPLFPSTFSAEPVT